MHAYKNGSCCRTKLRKYRAEAPKRHQDPVGRAQAKTPKPVDLKHNFSSTSSHLHLHHHRSYTFWHSAFACSWRRDSSWRCRRGRRRTCPYKACALLEERARKSFLSYTLTWLSVVQIYSDLIRLRDCLANQVKMKFSNFSLLNT